MFPRIQIGLPDLVGQKDDIDAILMDHNSQYHILPTITFMLTKS